MQVVVKSGRTTVFEGITDATGRFVTPPLEPGVYSFEVRIPKGFVSTARYFLALSGAKPLGEAMTGPRVPLMMSAEVRRPTSVRGQVTGRRGAIATATTTAQTAGATPTSGTTAPTAPRTTTTTTASRPVPSSGRSSIGLRSAPLATTTPVQRAIAPRTTSATPVRGAFNPTRPPEAPTTGAAPGAQGLSARPAGFQPRIIDGRRHYWVPIAPGSTIGRWVPERSARAAATAAPATPVQRTAPRATPTPTPSPRRR